MHTKLPWNIHPLYADAKSYAFQHQGNDLVAFEVTIASGDKTIGDVRMVSGGIFPRVDNEQECRDNAVLILKAVNSHDALVAALNAYQAAGIGVATDYSLQSVALNLAVTALAGVDE